LLGDFTSLMIAEPVWSTRAVLNANLLASILALNKVTVVLHSGLYSLPMTRVCWVKSGRRAILHFRCSSSGTRWTVSFPGCREDGACVYCCICYRNPRPRHCWCGTDLGQLSGYLANLFHWYAAVEPQSSSWFILALHLAACASTMRHAQPHRSQLLRQVCMDA